MRRTKGPSQRQLVDLLRTVPLFAGCNDRELKAIAGSGKEVEFAAESEICTEGETGVGLHVIVQGEAKVKVGGRTRRKLGPGAFFGEIALLDGGPRSATVVSETPLLTFSVPVWNFRSLLKAQPALAVKMLEEVCRRLRGADSSLHH